MKKIISLLILILFTNLNFAQALPDSSNYNEHVFGKEYFPLNDKMELIYKSTVGESKRVVKKTDSLYVSSIIADNFRYTQTLCEKDDGLYLTKTEQEVHIFLIFSKHAKVIYSEPALQLKFPMKVGDEWEWNGYQVKNESDTTIITMKGRVLKEEVIEVPAGKFNTVKVEFTVEDLGAHKTTFTQWLAKGLGSVKMIVKVEGHGIIQIAMSILGYDYVVSELKEVKFLE